MTFYYNNLLKQKFREFFMDEEKLKKLVLGFFNSLKCRIENLNGQITVSNVPKAFEEFYGKSGPYKLIFEEGTFSEGEIVAQGSSLVNAITRYLRKGGSTTLLKIDFEVDPVSEIKKHLSLKNCEISNVSKKHKNDFFVRFSFLTNFSYLNEKESFMKDIYVYEGKAVDGNLEGYKVLEGKKEDVVLDEIKEDYAVARNKLKESLEPKIVEAQEEISHFVEQEIAELRSHYNHQIVEISREIERSVERMKKLEEEYLSTRDRSSFDKIKKLKDSISEIDKSGKLSSIRNEEERAISEIMHKHTLDISTKVINTTIIYYPIFSFNLILEGKNGKRILELDFNPLTKKLDKLSCESCKKNLERINLCSNGHVVCDNCLNRCAECGGQFCSKCLERRCNVCGKPLCKNCVKVCRGCGKVVCATHLRNDCVSGEERCVSCLRACLRCHGMCEERYFGEAMDGSKVCQRCLVQERGKKIIDSFADR